MKTIKIFFGKNKGKNVFHISSLTGYIELTQETREQSVVFTIYLEGLTPNKLHGFHIHENPVTGEVIIKKDKMADEAEPILEEVFAHLQIKSEKNIWQTLNDAPFEQQDKILSSLMNILMDPTDKRSFKAVVYPGLQCTKLWEKYPALHKLISTHFQKPKAQQFLDEFNALEDEQLPPQFAQARLKICEVCNKLSMWQKGKIWWKF